MAELNVSKTALNGVLLIEPPTVFRDFRGQYMETYNEQMYKEAGISVRFVQDDVSVSSKDVLRGIHGDATTWKLVSCIYGSFYLVVVDCNAGTLDFGKWQSFTLTDIDPQQVLVPPMFGVGHLIVSEKAVFQYKQSTYYDKSTQFGYMWNDPRFNISWPTESPILSERDQKSE